MCMCCLPRQSKGVQDVRRRERSTRKGSQAASFRGGGLQQVYEGSGYKIMINICHITNVPGSAPNGGCLSLCRCWTWQLYMPGFVNVLSGEMKSQESRRSTQMMWSFCGNSQEQRLEGLVNSQDQGLTRQNIGPRKDSKEVTVLVSVEVVAIFTMESTVYLSL